jgi:uncharacterized lipoprotein YmbA
MNRNRARLLVDRARRTLAIVVGFGLVAGCASKAPSESFYALNDGGVLISTTSSAPRAGQPTVAQKSTLPGIVVSAVTIPELVDRPQIVTRDSTHRVIVSEQNLWAESIRSGVARTLTTRLARALAEAGRPAQVAAYPQTSIVDPVLKITIDIVRFDAEPNGEAIVDAVWSVRRVGDDSVRTGHTVASAPIAGASYEAIVRGWNDAVEVVDRDIAAMVLQIGIEAPPKTTR